MFVWLWQLAREHTAKLKKKKKNQSYILNKAASPGGKKVLQGLLTGRPTNFAALTITPVQYPLWSLSTGPRIAVTLQRGGTG